MKVIGPWCLFSLVVPSELIDHPEKAPLDAPQYLHRAMTRHATNSCFKKENLRYGKYI